MWLLCALHHEFPTHSGSEANEALMMQTPPQERNHSASVLFFAQHLGFGAFRTDLHAKLAQPKMLAQDPTE